MTKPRTFWTVTCDTLYWFFEPVTLAFRGSRTAPQHYRATYRILGYPNLRTVTKEFTAAHDREARRTAEEFREEIASSESVAEHYGLEVFRTIQKQD